MKNSSSHAGQTIFGQRDNLRPWYVFCQGRIVLQPNSDGTCSVPLAVECPVSGASVVLQFPWLDDSVCMTACVDSEDALPSGFILLPLRESYNFLSISDYRRAGKAREMINWDAQNRFCGHCGTALEQRTAISKYCPKCDAETWAKLSPAVIVLISRGDEVLLVQSRTYAKPFFGLVAGFVELGENLEECVRREVKEETSLEITNLHYAWSQSWPYPRNLMAGFTAEYKSGEVHLQNEELCAGGWFRYDNLPTLPDSLSIARQLIDAWLESKKKK